MTLKVGSWYQACAEAVANKTMNVILLIPGWRNMIDLQKAGATGPPPGTVMMELHDGEPAFQVLETHGPDPLDRRSARLLTLALAAMIDLAAADPSPETEVSGQLPLPGAIRGRYRAVRAPVDPEAADLVPVMSVIRNDLFSGGDATVSFMRVTPDGYRDLANQAGHADSPGPAPKVPIEDSRSAKESIPIVLISGEVKSAWSVADKLHAAKPLGIVFGETPDGFTAVVTGSPTSYVLMPSGPEALAARDWWQEETRGSDGACALVVADTTPHPEDLDRWNPAHVFAVFPFGKLISHASH